MDAGTNEFGRTLSHKMARMPYYAVQMGLRYYRRPWAVSTSTEQMQVLNTAQEPIEGLYAAGEVVGGLEGDIYLGGTLFGWAMTSGYDAGKAVSEAIK